MRARCSCLILSRVSAILFSRLGNGIRNFLWHPTNTRLKRLPFTSQKEDKQQQKHQQWIKSKSRTSTTGWKGCENGIIVFTHSMIEVTQIAMIITVKLSVPLIFGRIHLYSSFYANGFFVTDLPRTCVSLCVHRQPIYRVENFSSRRFWLFFFLDPGVVVIAGLILSSSTRYATLKTTLTSAESIQSCFFFSLYLIIRFGRIISIKML